jgi:hypothetical protein
MMGCAVVSFDYTVFPVSAEHSFLLMNEPHLVLSLRI